MQTNKNEKTVREPLFHISKRGEIKWWKSWLIRLSAILIVSLLCIILTCAFTKLSPFSAIGYMFSGNFGFGMAWDTIYNIAILLLISLAVAPAFKMKFWNIGADGQTLMGILACAICSQYLGGKVPDALLLVMMFVASILASVIWAVIPAIFKAIWNTNETLFTLMMNYIATLFVKFFLESWMKKGSTGSSWDFNYGLLPEASNKYLLPIIIIAAVTAVMFIYLKYSKQGYEISVVGESVNTAKYSGINVKKVVIRTLVISGIICGIAGFILVNIECVLDASMVGGMGFTAIIVAWLAKFNPVYMILTSFLIIFSGQGMSEIMTRGGIVSGSQAFPDIITGLLFFFIIGCEFFIRYRIDFKKKQKKTEEVKA